MSESSNSNDSAASEKPVAAPKPAGVLLPWQRALYTVLLVPLGLMAANSIYLVGFTRISQFYMTMLLLHLGLGSLLAIGFFTFATTHAKRMFPKKNPRAKRAGVGIFILALLCVSTGLFMTFKGATLNNRTIYLAHVFSIPLALIAFILHRRSHSHQMAFRRLYAWGGAVALFVGLMFLFQRFEKPPKRIVNNNGDTAFFPSSAETFDQGLLDAKTLASNDYCGECHPDSKARWEKSAHRFSSFNNPFYRRSVELMADRVGRERTKWCSGCHDPVVLFTGKMGKATQASFKYDDWEGQQGLTCMSCHSITEVKDLRGNGGFVIEESKQYPFAFTKNPVLKEVNKLLIRMEPSLHRKTFMKPFMRTPEFCSSCHKVAILPPVNGYHWLRGQDHYDSWQDSGVSGFAVRSFYDPPKTKACRDCHLPDFPSKEFGNRDGKIHDHVFPAANTALPTLRSDKATVEQIQKFLKKSLTVDLFAIRRGDQIFPIGPELPALVPGETVDVEVVVRTRALGHQYTNGTSDSNETWVSFAARNGDRTIQESGTLDSSGRLDPAADVLSSKLIGHDGRHMDRRQPQDIHVPLYANGIGPGADRVVHYRFQVPRDAKGEVTLRAALNYRKFSRDYSIFVGGAAAPALPVTEISGDQVQLPVAPQKTATAATARANEDKPWLRWNDYGIGLFLQGDLKMAEKVWRKVAELAPDKPDGPLNLARALIQEGTLDEAKTALAEAEKRRPGWGKTSFFRAMVAKEEGRLEDALVDFNRVLAKFPRDRVVNAQIGRIHYLGGHYREALAQYQIALEIDPEDLNAHYNALLCLRALGRTKEAEAEESWYRYHKDDERGRALMAEFRRSHPLDNRESLPVHVHDDPRPPEAAVPDWMGEIGPRGYEYKNRTYETPKLKDDRPAGASRPFAAP